MLNSKTVYLGGLEFTQTQWMSLKATITVMYSVYI